MLQSYSFGLFGTGEQRLLGIRELLSAANDPALSTCAHGGTGFPVVGTLSSGLSCDKLQNIALQSSHTQTSCSEIAGTSRGLERTTSLSSQDAPLPPIACVQEHRSQPSNIFSAPSIPSLAMHSQAAPSATDATLLAKLCALKSVVGPLAMSGLEQASMDALGWSGGLAGGGISRGGGLLAPGTSDLYGGHGAALRLDSFSRTASAPAAVSGPVSLSRVPSSSTELNAAAAFAAASASARMGLTGPSGSDLSSLVSRSLAGQGRLPSMPPNPAAGAAAFGTLWGGGSLGRQAGVFSRAVSGSSMVGGLPGLVGAEMGFSRACSAPAVSMVDPGSSGLTPLDLLCRGGHGRSASSSGQEPNSASTTCFSRAASSSNGLVLAAAAQASLSRTSSASGLPMGVGSCAASGFARATSSGGAGLGCEDWRGGHGVSGLVEGVQAAHAALMESSRRASLQAWLAQSQGLTGRQQAPLLGLASQGIVPGGLCGLGSGSALMPGAAMGASTHGSHQALGGAGLAQPSGKDQGWMSAGDAGGSGFAGSAAGVSNGVWGEAGASGSGDGPEGAGPGETAGSGDGARSGKGRKGLIIQDPKGLAADFAVAVTAVSNRGGDWVARNGEESLFSTLRRILPQVCQPGDGRHRLKGKIAGPEFNKLLQGTCGFVCARTRKKSLARTAGNWLFCNRRWLSPDQEDDKRSLERSYDELCAKHPALASCSKAHFLTCIRDVSASWSRRMQ